MNEPKTIIVSAPSGCGKGTILHSVFEGKDMFYSVSCTTRAPREGEVNGTDYHFISTRKFRSMIKDDLFLEHACFSGNYYGTPKEPVDSSLAEGKDVILEIETQGAFQVKEKRPETPMIFILPPSVAELRRRLKKRGTEDDATIEKRMANAASEIANSVKYDYVMMNDDLDAALADFVTIYNAIKNGDGSADRFSPKNENTVKMINEVLENA